MNKEKLSEIVGSSRPKVVCYFFEIPSDDMSKPSRFKYEGELLYDDDETYVINDFSTGIVRLPKARCTLKYGRIKVPDVNQNI